MCGLIGEISTGSAALAGRVIETGLGALSHRGPDDRGYVRDAWQGRSVTLGHTRLSIIDLSSAGHQPMQSADGRYTIIFNGEIYNYRELRAELASLGCEIRTDTDTEVLLTAWAQWGENCLHRLSGMFAFAIYDSTSGAVTLVRDAFGIKPLFYYEGAGCIWFASEIPALLEILPTRPAIDLEQSYRYLVLGHYDDGESTFYCGVKHLRPGHVMRVELAGSGPFAPRRWWWPAIGERRDLSFDDAAELLREKFLHNVRLHLRSDVPLGAALSGGIDSSSVVCAMRHLEPDMPIHTFSFIAPGSAHDEERWADMVNRHVSANAHKSSVNPAELSDDLDDMIRAQGEPFGSTSIYAQYRVFQLARDQGVTVTLDGQGADELLAGYEGYPAALVRSKFEKRAYLQALSFLRGWSAWPGRTNAQALKVLISMGVPDSAWGLAQKAIGRDFAPRWLKPEYLREQGVGVSAPGRRKRAKDGQGRRLVETLREVLTERGLVSLLRHGDRNSMRWSIESRVPFLTPDMAEFLLTLPESYLVSGAGETKSVFRRAMRGIVPDAILDRRDKIGFQTPEREWLHRLGDRVYHWLDAADQLPFLNHDACLAEVRAVISGETPDSGQAWRLINFCRWAQTQNFRS